MKSLTSYWNSSLQYRSLARCAAPLLLRPAPASSRAASLSAIHRGLRRSERAQYGEPRDSQAAFPSRERRTDRDTVDRTDKALEGAGGKRQRQKLVSKLRRKQDEEDGPGKQTRRKRFMNPDEPYGKQSLVWQLKHGSLQDLTKKIDEPVRPRSSFREGGGGRDRPQRSFGAASRGPQTSFARSKPPSFFDKSDSRTPGRRERPSFTRSDRRPERREHNTDRKSDAGSAMTSSDFYKRIAGEDERDVSAPAPRQRKGNMMPMTIKYTTAASQFLYGRSVVKSALEQARRKLYNLYIYGGENRSDVKDNLIISTLAKEKRVPITIVPNEDQRLMDKMSMGRPHNGFVLETSPLPLKPVTSLGSVEETPSKLGFHVQLDHQTKEEEAINGTDTFVRRSSSVTPRPLVLLLNEILDPGNLGGILRTASYLGVDAVGITNRNTSNLTPVVLKSAAGSVEEITIFTIDSPVKFLEESKKAGWKSYAAVAAPSKKLSKLHSDKFVSTEEIEKRSPLSTDPCILVLGNEGHGLSKQLKVAADHELSVPRFMQDSCVDSLNVSVAAGLLCHAFVKEPWANHVMRSKSRPENLSHAELSPGNGDLFSEQFKGQVRQADGGSETMF